VHIRNEVAVVTGFANVNREGREVAEYIGIDGDFLGYLVCIVSFTLFLSS
jgi:hypothetical protein